MAVDRPPIPTLLAIGAVHHHLIRTGLRTETSIVAETAQCFSTHQLAVMVGYGAHAVCPYLAFETARQWRVASRWALRAEPRPICDTSFYYKGIPGWHLRISPVLHSPSPRGSGSVPFNPSF